MRGQCLDTSLRQEEADRMMARAVEGPGLIPTPYVVRGVWTDFSRGRASKIRYLPDRQMGHCRAQRVRESIIDYFSASYVIKSQ